MILPYHFKTLKYQTSNSSLFSLHSSLLSSFPHKTSVRNISTLTMSVKECHHHKGKKHKLWRRIFWGIVIFAFIVLLTVLIIWAILKPSKPTFILQDVTVYGFNATIPNFLTSSFQVTLSSRNPNDKIGVYYDRLDTYVTYRNQQVTYRTSIPPSYQGHKEEDEGWL